MGKELTNAIQFHTMFNINIFGFSIPVTDTVVVTWIIMAFLVVFSIVITRKMKLVPEGKQNLAELIVDSMNSFSKDTIGHHSKPYTPYLGSIMLFLIVANIASLFNIIPSTEWLATLPGLKFFENVPELAIRPPTRDITVTACMAIISILIVIVSGIRYKGFRGWLKTFLEPIPIILPFKILEYFIRPLSLALRLFGNVLGGFIVMELINSVVPLFVPPVLSLYFDLFDGALQAYVFVFLTSLYIGEIIE
jgi:F-type H+-transporting ATPase subunit a